MGRARNQWEEESREQLGDCYQDIVDPRDFGKSSHLGEGWPGVKGSSHWGELEVSGGNGEVNSEAYSGSSAMRGGRIRRRRSSNEVGMGRQTPDPARRALGLPAGRSADLSSEEDERDRHP